MRAAIQNAKHSGFSTYHLQDIKCIGSLKIFCDSFNNDSGELKPVMTIIADGGGSDGSKIDKNYRMCD